ncbi:protein unc-119 homolog A [Clupea harengus]|uniref:Protein unc-119 homolog A n=1 Tax=Clupea harengus TaxID=7950 RepID=A0A6P3VTK7_CLUHA|nr:protein unc-119 homolog A [Clupea harengus]
MEGQNYKELESEEEEWESPPPETELGQGADMEMDGQGAGESDMVDWNGFLTGEAVAEAQGDLWPNWDPNEPVTPQQVLRLAGYTQDYLCCPEENIYNISFSRFKIRDMESGAVILDFKKHCPTEISAEQQQQQQQPPRRFIQYHFSPAFLSLREIGATWEFTVGTKAVNKFRLIERHYFRDLLLKSFDFEIGYCIPDTRNTCEHIYSLPELEPEMVGEMIASPFETRSDSFYFANNKLIMHHKAEYSFCPKQDGIM